MADLMDSMQEDAEAPVEVSNKALAEVAALASEQLLLEQRLKDAEQTVKDTKEELKAVQEGRLPDKMKELGLLDFTLADGAKITIKDDVACSISAANRSAAFAWFRSEGHGDLIKNEVTAKFARGEEKRAKDVMATLLEMGVVAEQSESVHAQTLKAFVKEQRGDGVELPEAISVYDYSKSKVTRRK